MSGEQQIRRQLTVSGGGISLGGSAEVQSVDVPGPFQKEFPANATNVEVTLPTVNLLTCVEMAIVATKDCTVKINSTSATGTELLELKAGKMLQWFLGDPVSNKFLAVDVTKWYVTTGAEATTLKILVAHDATPSFT